MPSGLHTDRNGELWYLEDGEAQAVSWDEGISDPIPEFVAVLLFGPLQFIADETKEKTE